MPKRDLEEALGGEPLTKAQKKKAKADEKVAAKEAKRVAKKQAKQDAKAEKKAEKDAGKAAKEAAKAARRAAKNGGGAGSSSSSSSGGGGGGGGGGGAWGAADDAAGAGDGSWAPDADRRANDLGAKPVLEKKKWGDERTRTSDQAAGGGGAVGGAKEGGDGGEVTNVTGTCRVCFSNLSFQIDEDKLAAAVKATCGEVTNVDWLLEAGTGKFYGKAVVDFATAEAATAGVLMRGSKIMGRPCRAEFAKPKKDDGRNGGKAKKTKLGKKPEGCVTIFLGNLDFQMNREGLESFFGDCGAIKDVRWVKDKVTQEFKGCAFVEFWESASVDKAIGKSSEELLGRKMRMSYQA